MQSYPKPISSYLKKIKSLKHRHGRIRSGNIQCASIW